jgi:hypothetical protein
MKLGIIVGVATVLPPRPLAPLALPSNGDQVLQTFPLIIAQLVTTHDS